MIKHRNKERLALHSLLLLNAVLPGSPARVLDAIQATTDHQWWFVALIGIVAGSALITFERYRAARMRELKTALTASEDLTQQLTNQQIELGKVTRILALDYAATQALSESGNAAEAAVRLLQTICVTTMWDLGSISDLDPQSNQTRCIGLWHRAAVDSPDFNSSSQYSTLIPDPGLSRSVLASGQPHWVTYIRKSGGLPRSTTTGKQSLGSGFGFPILVGSEVIGVLELFSFELRKPDQDLIEIMSSLGSHIGQLLQRKRAEEALHRIQEERLVELQRVRRRIATDLHDDVGSSLTKIALLTEAMRENVTEKNGTASERLTAITNVTNELVDTMSDIVWAINPQKDSLIDLSHRMRRFASDIFTTSQIAFRFSAPSRVQDVQLGANLRREVFLIFKETVNNIAKHSDCTEVSLEMAIEEGWLTLSINDNGKGFNPDLVKADTGYLTSHRRGGNGLASMRRRAREMGGRFDIVTDIGKGAAMSLSIPIEHGTELNRVALTAARNTRPS